MCECETDVLLTCLESILAMFLQLGLGQRYQQDGDLDGRPGARLTREQRSSDQKRGLQSRTVSLEQSVLSNYSSSARRRGTYNPASLLVHGLLWRWWSGMFMMMITCSASGPSVVMTTHQAPSIPYLIGHLLVIPNGNQRKRPRHGSSDSFLFPSPKGACLRLPGATALKLLLCIG